ncbi:unnamed protein product [Boreogadus saida]
MARRASGQSQPCPGGERRCVSRGVTAVCGSEWLPGPSAPGAPCRTTTIAAPRMGAIAGIPCRNRDALEQGTDILAAAPQSIHPSGSGSSERPRTPHLDWDGAGPPG